MNPSQASSAKIILPGASHEFQHISILGAGLVGGSIAHVIHSLGMVPHIWDPDVETANLAKQFGWNVYESPGEAASRGDLVILAGPVDTIISTAKIIVDSIKKGAVVTDVGSVKESISIAFSDIFKDKDIEAIPGHPMAGKASHGLSSADISLFRGATWIFTDNFSSPALPALVCFSKELGAKRFISMDSEEHDILVALISHIPQIVSTALTAGVSGQEEFFDAIQIAGGGFKDMSRLASSSWEMWRPILKENRESLIIPLTAVRNLIDEMIRDLLAGQSDRFEPIFLKANKARETYEHRDALLVNGNGAKEVFGESISTTSERAWLDHSLGYLTIRTTANTSFGHMRLALMLLAQIREVDVNVEELVKGNDMVEQIARLVKGNYETTWTADGLPVRGVAFGELLYVIP